MKETKIKAVENYLKKGRILTKRDAVKKWEYYNVGDGIHILRKKYGYNAIKTTMIKSGDTRHAEYKMVI